MNIAHNHQPHPHLLERTKHQPQHAGKLHKAGMSRQDKIAKFICDWVGTMYAAYLFTLIAFIALPQAIESHSTTVLINWFSGNWMQFVLLPIIMVAGNLASRLINHFIEESYKNSVLIYKDNQVSLEIQNDMHLMLKQNTDTTNEIHSFLSEMREALLSPTPLSKAERALKREMVRRGKQGREGKGSK